MSLASDDSVVDKIDSLLASAIESSEGTREGRSIAKSDPKIAPCFFMIQNDHVFSAKFRRSHQGAISEVFFSKVNRDRNLVPFPKIRCHGHAAWWIRHQKLNVLLVFHVWNLHDRVYDQVVS